MNEQTWRCHQNQDCTGPLQGEVTAMAINAYENKIVLRERKREMSTKSDPGFEYEFPD